MTEIKKIDLKYSVLVRKEGNQYASWCPEFDVASCGPDIESACKDLKEAVACLIEAYTENGELIEFLEQRGISLKRKYDCPPIFLSEAQISVPAI